ncbi:hypothetical protein [Allosphingosinicella indica]|uniref:Uncharacterized protein n=1 Tax=Allosphingosinicella indica TaxID=941907 RepID=A0A1X7G0E3_9SPHN|nr:hypothetical protein [Allosphingosinicella indica]SMF61789.1 hypothetical protein SAMN06295910_0782 [Allosphingosinicella indica]
MRDEFEGRLWADHGTDFARTVDQLLADIGQVFSRLAQIQFAAPWRSRQRQTRLG